MDEEQRRNARVDEREAIRRIRAKIFRLAKQSPSLGLMHWYMQLDDCFKNDEFQEEKLSDLRWLLDCLRREGEPVDSIRELAGKILVFRLIL